MTSPIVRRGTGCLLAVLILLSVTAQAAVEPQTSVLPPWDDVETAVRRHLTERGFEPYDILRSDVEPLFELFDIMGWNVEQRRAILGAVLSDRSFLVRELRKPAGRKFAEQISIYPLAFDRLDRLSGLKDGKDTVRALIKGPDGYKLLEYMTEAPGGIELGRMLSRDPGGKNFNAPTGRIYTEADLVGRLRQVYLMQARQEQERQTIEIEPSS